jgi:hypothetical protein
MMPYDVIEARHVGGFVLWLRFRDGTVGEIDLTAELHGPVFEPLRDPGAFRAFQVHPEFHTVTWPNGADFAPEFLRARNRARCPDQDDDPRRRAGVSSGRCRMHTGKP